MILRLVVFTLGFALGAFTQAVAQLNTPAPTPQVPAQTSTPETTPTVQPTPIPSPTAFPPTPVPTATPTPASPYKYVVEPTPNPNATPGAPQINRIEVNDATVHPGGPVAVRVTTSPNVKRVYATVEGRAIEIQKAQDGIFAGLTTLPSFIPPWFWKTYQVTFTAMTDDGKKAWTTIPIRLGP